MSRIAPLAVGLVAVATAIAISPSAWADPPNCTAADLAGVHAGVSAASAAYLFSHPDVNAHITGLRNLPKDEAHTQLEQYLDANPQIKDELQAIRQPLVDLGDRCGGE